VGARCHPLAGEFLVNLVGQVAVRFAVLEGAVGQLDKGLVDVALGIFAPEGDFVGEVLLEGFFERGFKLLALFLAQEI
jgi:hypothetical protein